MDPHSRSQWSALVAQAIPTKLETPALDVFLNELAVRHPGARVLDLGCGNGGVTLKLVAHGFSAVGVDLHPQALAQAALAVPTAHFYARDVAAVSGVVLPEPSFDAAVCQLLFSVVGDASDRAQALQNARALLAPRAQLYASFSGLSDDLNPEYAALYARDASLTGEHGSYFSRDADGRVLYRTHHFSQSEIEALFQTAGLALTRLEARIEASSRRPEQRARFYYVCALRND